MRSIKTLAAVLMTALLLATGVSFAGSDVNEVGAMLVFPVVISPTYLNVETYVTVTNASADAVTVHLSYVNGYDDRAYNPASKYCYECDFEIELSGNDTETLVVSYNDYGIEITNEDNYYFGLSCNWPFGMIIATLEDGNGNTLTDNVLLGEEVVVDYWQGTAFSIPAIPFQGADGGDGTRSYGMDDEEYGKMPRIVAADFLAQDIEEVYEGHAASALALFTLGFERQLPPLTDCSVTGFDAFEHPFSSSIQFGCWSYVELCEVGYNGGISPEFCYPNLGLDSYYYDTHGWLQLNCRVDSDPQLANGFDANGGVHGAIVQYNKDVTDLPIADQDTKAAIEADDLANGGYKKKRAVSWARLLYQSVTTGDAVTLTLESPSGGLN